MLTSYLIHRPALMALLVGWDGDQFVGEMMGRWGKTLGSTSCQPRRTTRFALQNRGGCHFYSILYHIVMYCLSLFEVWPPEFIHSGLTLSRI